MENVDTKSLTIRQGWTRLECRPVLAGGKFVRNRSFIYPGFKIDKQRPFIRNQEELERFLAENLTVPHDEKYLFKLCNQIREEGLLQENLEKMHESLEKLCAELFNPRGLPSEKMEE